MAKGLILIDIQNDYFPGGKMELVGMEEASANAGRLLNSFREQGLPTFHIQHIFNDPGAPFFLPETEGVKIHEEYKEKMIKASGDKYKNKIYWPEHFPPFSTFRADEEGKLFVMTYEKDTTQREYMHDILRLKECCHKL